MLLLSVLLFSPIGGGDQQVLVTASLRFIRLCRGWQSVQRVQDIY